MLLKAHDEEHHESQPIVTDAIDWPVAKPETPQIPDNWDDWDADPMSSNTFVSNSAESVPQEHGFSASPFPETIDNNFGINDFANSTGSNQPTNQFSASPFPETVDNNSFGISDFANSAEANQLRRSSA